MLKHTVRPTDSVVNFAFITSPSTSPSSAKNISKSPSSSPSTSPNSEKKSTSPSASPSPQVIKFAFLKKPECQINNSQS